MSFKTKYADKICPEILVKRSIILYCNATSQKQEFVISNQFVLWFSMLCGFQLAKSYELVNL